MHIGAHVSITGGYDHAVVKAAGMGCNAMQIFSIAPRGWNKANVNLEQADLFAKSREKTGVEFVVFHASYLVNLADNDRIGPASRDILIHELSLASRLNVAGSIIHLGSFKHKEDTLPFEVMPDRHQILIDNIKRILEKIPDNAWFIAENAGTRKIGRSLDELARIIADVDDPRMKVCLDTCHLHAAGYDFRTPEATDSFIQEFDTKIGLDRLAVIHVNDSKDPFGSLRDRHENIGEGFIGIEPFNFLINHPRLSDARFILEVPGFDKEGPDKENVDILKNLITSR